MLSSAAAMALVVRAFATHARREARSGTSAKATTRLQLRYSRATARLLRGYRYARAELLVIRRRRRRFCGAGDFRQKLGETALPLLEQG